MPVYMDTYYILLCGYVSIHIYMCVDHGVGACICGHLLLLHAYVVTYYIKYTRRDNWVCRYVEFFSKSLILVKVREHIFTFSANSCPSVLSSRIYLSSKSILQESETCIFIGLEFDSNFSVNPTFRPNKQYL